MFHTHIEVIVRLHRGRSHANLMSLGNVRTARLGQRLTACARLICGCRGGPMHAFYFFLLIDSFIHPQKKEGKDEGGKKTETKKIVLL